MGHKPSVNSSALSLDEYVSLLSELPRPGEDEIDNFVRFVASAHSWYKRIPYLLPGVPFHFFMDPFAGSNFSVTWTGRIRVTPRIEQGFHYSWLPTETYLEQFGHLAYSCEAAGRFADVRLQGRVVSSDCSPTILGRTGKLTPLPSEILDAGTVGLTAVIHPASIGILESWPIELSRRDSPQEITWATESGGQEGLQSIIARCRELRESKLTDQSKINEVRQAAALKEAMQIFEVLYQETRDLELTDPTRVAELNQAAVLEARQLLKENDVSVVVSDDGDLLFVDPELYALVAPEQRRQRSEMAKAIKRVCALVWGG